MLSVDLGIGRLRYRQIKPPISNALKDPNDRVLMALNRGLSHAIRLARCGLAGDFGFVLKFQIFFVLKSVDFKKSKKEN